MSTARTLPLNRGPLGADSARLTAFAFLAGLLAITAWTPELGALPGGMPLFYIVCAVAILVLVRSPRIQPVIGYTQHGIAQIIFASCLFIGGWALLTVFQSEEPLRVGRPVAAYCIGPALFWILNRLIPPNRIDNVIEWQLYCAAVAAIFSLLAVYIPFLGEAIFGNRDRAEGFFKHPNQFAIALSTIAPVLTAMVLASPGNRVRWGAVLAVVVVGFVLAGSKANSAVGLVSMSLLALFGAITHRSAVRSIFFLLGFAVVGVAVLIIAWEVILTLNPRMALLLTTLASGQEIASVNERYLLWDLSVKQFLADPLFGQGGGASLMYGADESVNHSHNLVLDAMRTLGIPGLVAVMVLTLALLALVVYQSIIAVTVGSVARFERMKLVGLTLGFLSYYIANLSSDSFGPSTSPIFWIVLITSLWQCQKVQALSRDAASGKYRPRHSQR